ncbi:MAG: transposase [Acidaminococcales bacterium]|nr:transposase [Acidaminococcales bacterium]
MRGFAGRLRLLFKRAGRPAYSPDLNPIEKIWANMKRELADILSMKDDVVTAVSQYFLRCT